MHGPCGWIGLSLPLLTAGLREGGASATLSSARMGSSMDSGETRVLCLREGHCLGPSHCLGCIFITVLFFQPLISVSFSFSVLPS